MQEGSNNTPKIVGAVVISAAIIASVLFVVLQSDDSTDTTSNVSVATVETESADSRNRVEADEPQATESTAVTTYKNGTYSASTSYKVPEGNVEDISIEVTLADDIVTVLSVDTVATNRESIEHQDRFDPLIEGEVEGEDLDDVDVFRLGGASLTSDAFNDLIDAVRTQAEA